MCLLASQRVTPSTQYRKHFANPKRTLGVLVYKEIVSWGHFSVLILIGKEERDPYLGPILGLILQSEVSDHKGGGL
jgi:hypothetical protein